MMISRDCAAWLAVVIATGGCARTTMQHERIRNEVDEVPTRLEMTPGTCTEEICPSDTPCCHTCTTGSWLASGAPPRPARAAKGQLPSCRVDGCGRCTFALDAFGKVVAEEFVATRWTEVPPDGCGAQRCDGAGACDAVLADGTWLWQGDRCTPFYASGCNLVGRDCARLYANQTDCQQRHAGCGGP